MWQLWESYPTLNVGPADVDYIHPTLNVGPANSKTLLTFKKVFYEDIYISKVQSDRMW